MIQVIDYGAGNLRSVSNALEKLDKDYQIIKRPEEISDSAKIIFPGVGAAGNAMEKLNERNFVEKIPKLRNPFLGICLGMQLLTCFSEENEATCLGIINGQTKIFPSSVKIPQIGWNRVKIEKDSFIFQGIPDDSYFYFVNSYYVVPKDESIISSISNYYIDFAASIEYKNITAVQFHPEKSSNAGVSFFKKWLF